MARVRDHFEFVYTSKHGSWLNMAEIELNVMIGQYLNRRIGCPAEVETAVSAGQTYRNNFEVKIAGPFTTRQSTHQTYVDYIRH